MGISFLLIPIVGFLILITLLSNGKIDMKYKNLIFLSPLLVGILLYLALIVFDWLLIKLNIIPPYGCDGGALFIVMISFLLIGIGLLINIPRFIIYLKERWGN